MRLTEQTRQALALAEEVAREFRHDYVGTEHLLLGLLRQGVKVKGLEIEKVAAEVERLVLRGPAEQATGGSLPRTPRANKAIEYAEDEARLWNQRHVDVGHLMLGLLKEPEGVGGVVMRNLGIELSSLRERVLHLRLGQFRIVERVVRPVRASTVRKRKMREELLAHLEVIFEEERERLQDEDAALKQAARRFGKPEALTGELERALPWTERSAHFMERRFGWRAPERAWRYVLRVAMCLFWLLLAVSGVALLGAVMVMGWDRNIWILLAPCLAMTVFMPLDIFVLGVLYFRMRDALWGVFGSRKSRGLAFLYGVLAAGVTVLSAVGFTAMAMGGVELWRLLAFAAVAVGAALFMFVFARWHGGSEIGDTMWACLDLKEPPAELAS